jgi:hypothetical protein
VSGERQIAYRHTLLSLQQQLKSRGGIDDDQRLSRSARSASLAEALPA